MKLFTLFVFVALVSAQAHAATTGTLLLQGIVAVVNNIVVVPNGSNNTSLNIVAGESAKLVASVHEESNNLAGYKINVKSLNGGELRNLTDATKKTTYTLAYAGGTPITMTTAYQQVKNATAPTLLAGVNSAVNVTVQAFASAPAGTYEDTVTFQIVAN